MKNTASIIQNQALLNMVVISCEAGKLVRPR